VEAQPERMTVEVGHQKSSPIMSDHKSMPIAGRWLYPLAWIDPLLNHPACACQTLSPEGVPPPFSCANCVPTAIQHDRNQETEGRRRTAPTSWTYRDTVGHQRHDRACRRRRPQPSTPEVRGPLRIRSGDDRTETPADGDQWPRRGIGDRDFSMRNN
jgi:hypothetical protein